MKNYWGVSLWELALSATWFDPLVVACGALEEPASLDARVSRRRRTVCQSVLHSLLVVQGRIEVMSSILCGAVLSSS
jgi:hypothetical protein